MGCIFLIFFKGALTLKHRITVAGREFSLFQMTWPVFIELLLQMLVGSIDQIMLGQYNETAVAAVGNANQIITTLILSFNVISLAATIMLSQFLGAREEKKAEQIYTLAVGLNLIISLVLSAVLLFGADAILRLMQVPNEVFEEAKSYLLITTLSLPCQALMLTFSAFLRAHAKMLIIMCSTCLVNLLNIIGNIFFIYGVGPFPRLGAAGAAISTSICRTLGMFFLIISFFRTVPGARINLQDIRPFPKDVFKRFLSIGLPSGGEGLSYNLAQSTSLIFVNIMGTFAVTARMYTGMLAQISYMLINAVSQSTSIIIGYCIGAREFDQADRQNWKILKTFVPVTLIITVILALFARPLFGLFTSDPQVIALGQQLFIVEIFLEFGRCFNLVLVRNLQAAGDVAFPVTIGIFSQWIIGVGVSYLLGIYFGLGLVGVWIAFALDENLRALIFSIRWKKGKWRSTKTV